MTAAAKKDFNGLTITRRSVSASMDKATAAPQEKPTASKAEQLERMEALRTAGKKGCKAIRINMAFTPSNHRFIKIVSKATGDSMTETVNKILAAYRAEHAETFAQAKGILTDLESGGFNFDANQDKE